MATSFQMFSILNSLTEFLMISLKTILFSFLKFYLFFDFKYKAKKALKRKTIIKTNKTKIFEIK